MRADVKRKKEQLAALLAEFKRRKAGRKFETYAKSYSPDFVHPKTGEKDGYRKHRQMLCSHKGTVANLSANRTGKTQGGAFLVATHATGRYPSWWTGAHFNEPTEIWAAGITGDTTRDIIQAELLGQNYLATGVSTGMLPADSVIGVRKKQGNTVGAIESIYVRHITGGTSVISLKSMEQGRAKFQGTAKHLIWLDEEPEREGYDIYSECITRTMTIPGAQVLITWTPLKGMTELVKYILDHRGDKDFEVVNITWDDAPHLDADEKAKRIAGYKPHEIEARTMGVPTLKEGLIYPFAQKDITCPPPEMIQSAWAIVIGLDIGTTTPTSAVLLAWDQRTNRVTVVNEYAREGNESIGRKDHAEVLRSWGDGVYIACDPSANRTESDGKKTMKVYRDEYGLNINNADNAVDAGIETVREMFSSGRLKISTQCKELLKEIRFYQYKDGKPLKKDDHVLDGLRYGIMALKHARTSAYFKNAWIRKRMGGSDGSHGWKPGDALAGY